ncbi:MAG: glycosyltransferase family 4 protein [Chloroflexota bacterium]
MISKALVVGAYQRKAEEIAALGVDLTVLVPPSWCDRRGCQDVERSHTQGYTLKVIPIRFNGNFHLHHYPTLARELQQLSPEVVHMDEEPYNLATWLGLRAAKKVKAAVTFFTWQNLHRRYPPPFRWFEQANYAQTPVAIAGNQAAVDVLHKKGYDKEKSNVRIIPQFGVDPEIFSPKSGQPSNKNSQPFHIGYAGGFLSEKGLDVLLRACAKLQGDWLLTLVGAGEEQGRLQTLADTLAIADRVDIAQRLASDAMPAFYQQLDVFVLPSRTIPSWKEQFGRVLIESMATEVAVIGSNSGEIPNVIGDAGFIFPEDDVSALCAHLQRCLDDRTYCVEMGKRGRQRVLSTYTMKQIARQTVDVYEELLKRSR